SLQRLPRIRIAKERGDIDQHSVQQVDEFLRMCFEEGMIVDKGIDLQMFHPQRDAAPQAGTLVAAEIHTAAFLDVADEVFKCRFVGWRQVLCLRSGSSPRADYTFIGSQREWRRRPPDRRRRSPGSSRARYQAK